MDIQELEAFWWIAQTGSFNRAAERLFLTQPSVTARIQALEKDLGQALFERKPRGVRLTDAGRTLLPHAEQVLHDVRKARQALRQLEMASGGTLTVGSALTTSTYTLPRILSRYKSQYPAVDVAVKTGRSLQVQQFVLDDSVQLGLIHGPVSSPEIMPVALYVEPILLCVPPGHPLSGRKLVSAADLAPEPFITADRNSGYWSLVEQFWAAAGIVPRVTMELDSIEATKRMVVAGLGIGMLPRGTVEHELAKKELVSVPIDRAEHLIRETLLIHRKGKIWSGIANAFLETLAAEYNVEIPTGRIAEG
jgi:DNA-binding transcriptional LysR family regulator